MKPLADEVTRFELRIPLTLLESIDANGGKHNRSAWIREAIEEKLTREKLLKHIEDNADLGVEVSPKWDNLS